MENIASAEHFWDSFCLKKVMLSFLLKDVYQKNGKNIDQFKSVYERHSQQLKSILNIKKDKKRKEIQYYYCIAFLFFLKILLLQ